MSIVAVTSTRTSPGVTSLCVGLSWSWARRALRPLLVEADPAGGVLGLRFGRSGPLSLQTLRADARRGINAEVVHRNSVDLGEMDGLLAPTDPVVATRTLERTAGVLADELVELDAATIVDLGRLTERSPSLPLAAAASEVLVVTRPRVEDVQSLLYGIRELRASNCSVSLVVVGDRPHEPAEVARLADVPLAGVVADDPAVSSAFTGGRYRSGRLRRSTLWRSVDALGAQLLEVTRCVELEAAS